MAKPKRESETSTAKPAAVSRGVVGSKKPKKPDETVETGATAVGDRLADNISKLFADDSAEAAAKPPIHGETEPADRGETPEPLVDRHDNSTPAAINQSESSEIDGSVAADELPQSVTDQGSIGVHPDEWVLTPPADVAVAGAFGQLANTSPANNTRSVEEMAEEMMRPMLKNWLDENLPRLVERLVREELERVSRRR